MTSPSPNVWADPIASSSRFSPEAEARPLTPQGSASKYGTIAQPSGASAHDALLSAAHNAGEDLDGHDHGKVLRSERRAVSKTRFQEDSLSSSPRNSRRYPSRSRDRSASLGSDDVFESDEEEDGCGLSPGGERRFSRTRLPSGSGSVWSRITAGREDDEESLVEESDKQWGVLQMEIIQRIRGKRGLVGIYLGSVVARAPPSFRRRSCACSTR